MTSVEPTMRELLQASSLGCPRRSCEHLIGDHFATDWDSEGVPMDPMCRVEDCRCGHDWEDE